MNTSIRRGIVPGCVERIVELHASFYAAHAGFGPVFESRVARELGEFCNRYDEQHDGLWLALDPRGVQGSVAVDGLDSQGEGAHLRWFIVADAARGTGLGNALLAAAVEFCQSRQYERIFLWTFDGLAPARHLYEKFGFRLTLQRRGSQWGTEVDEQRFELHL